MPTQQSGVAARSEAEWRSWHDEVERGRRAPGGALAVTALHRIGVAPRRFTDLPGEWFHVSGVPVLSLPRGESVVLDTGETRGGIIRFDGLPTDHSVFVRWNDVTIEIGERANALILRPRRADAAARHEYAGTAVFPYSPRHVVRATFDRIDGVEIIADSEVDRVRHRIRVAGTARFTLDNRELAATVLHHKDGKRYQLLFRDRTSGLSTYYAGRVVSIEAEDSPYELVIDFNRALNPNTAYSPFWTSALPPAENTLPVPIEAGELAPSAG